MSERMLRLRGRYYRTIPIDQMGYVEEALELPGEKTALVSLHSWNIGCPGGPPLDPNYWVGMGGREATAEAYRIMCDHIRPALDVARQAGLAVCHVQSESIARRYPGNEGQAPISEGEIGACPSFSEAIQERSHGKDYMTKSGLADMDFPKVVAPIPGEAIVYKTEEFDRILRERGIVNLIYMGFATDMCILNAPGGVGPMFSLGYRVLLVREATVGVELPDMFEERVATRWGMRFIETHWGDTIGFEDFVENCKRLAREAAAV